MADDNKTVKVDITADTSGLVKGSAAAKAEIDALSKKFDLTRASAGTMAESIEKVQQQNKQMAATSRGVVSSIGLQAAENRELDDSLLKLLTTYDKAYAAQHALDTARDTLNQGLAAGLITQAQYNSALAGVTKRWAPLTAAEVAGAAAHGEMATQTAFLTRETRALFDELSSGRERQAIGTFTLLATRITGVGLAGIAAGAGVLGLVGGMAALAISAEHDQEAVNSVEARLAAMGKSGELSATQIRDLTNEIGLMPGVSTDAARKTVAAFASVQNIGGDMLQNLAKLADDFATATGTEVPKAAATLAAAFADPTEGAKKLDAALNFLTPDQDILIQHLARSGQTLQAQQVLYEALTARVQGLANNAMTPLQRKTDDLTTAWSNLWDTMSDSGAIESVTTAIIDVEDGLKWIIDHKQQVADAFWWVNPAQQWMSFYGYLTGSGKTPAQSAPLSTTTPPVTVQQPMKITGVAASQQVLDAEKAAKAALSTAAAYDTMGEKQRKLKDAAAQLSSAMAGLAAINQQDTTSYARLSAGLVAVNKQLADLGKNTKGASDEQKLLKQDMEGQVKAAQAMIDQWNAEGKARDKAAGPNPVEIRDKFLGQLPVNQLEKNMKDINMLYATGLINAQQFGDLSDQQFKKLADNSHDAFSELSNDVLGWGKDFSKTMASMVTTGKFSTEQLGQAFQELGNDIVASLFQKEIAGPLTSAGQGLIGNLVSNIFFAGSGASGGASLAGAASGGEISGGRAGGGSVEAGKTYIIGENGPELLRMGSQSGTVIPNSALNGPQQVQVQITNNGTPQKVSGAQATFDPKRAVIHIVLDDLKIGGPMSQAIGNTYGIKRSGG